MILILMLVVMIVLYSFIIQYFTFRKRGVEYVRMSDLWKEIVRDYTVAREDSWNDTDGVYEGIPTPKISRWKHEIFCEEEKRIRAEINLLLDGEN